MARTIKVADLFEDVEFELDGRTFKLRDGTPAVTEALAKINAELAQLHEEQIKRAEAEIDAAVEGAGELLSDEKRVERVEAAAAADVADTRQLVECRIAIIDTLLEPVKVKGVQTRSAKQMLEAAFEKEKIGTGFIQALQEALEEESEQRRRPTSAQKSDD